MPTNPARSGNPARAAAANGTWEMTQFPGGRAAVWLAADGSSAKLYLGPNQDGSPLNVTTHPVLWTEVQYRSVTHFRTASGNPLRFRHVKAQTFVSALPAHLADNARKFMRMLLVEYGQMLTDDDEIATMRGPIAGEPARDIVNALTAEIDTMIRLTAPQSA